MNYHHDTPYMIVSPSTETKEWTLKILRGARNAMEVLTAQMSDYHREDHEAGVCVCYSNSLALALGSIYRAWEDDLPDHWSRYNILIYGAVSQAYEEVRGLDRDFPEGAEHARREDVDVLDAAERIIMED